MQIPTNALIIVGDGQKALFLRNKGTPAHVELEVEQTLEHPDPPTREQGTDRPGRYRSGASPRSAFEETDWHRLEEERFADGIAATVNRLASAKRFETLVIVAPPKVLGEMRTHLHKESRDKVLAEVPKDLTSQPVPEIARLLAAHSS